MKRSGRFPWSRAFLLAVVGLTQAGAAEVGPPPVCRVGTAAAAMTVDGVFAETAWAGPEWASGFRRIEKDLAQPPAIPQTRFKVVTTTSAAYVAIECSEPNLDGLKAATPWRDGAVWSDDCIEVFFDPGNDGRYYHQVMVNPRGTIFDCHVADFGLVMSRLWNGAFRAAGSVDRAAGVWRVELEIPFGALVLPAAAGTTWRWNVARERHAGGQGTELSSWSPMSGSFHQPLNFGTATGFPADYRAFSLEVAEPAVTVSRSADGGRSLGVLWRLTNGTGQARRLRATLALEGTEGRTVAADAFELAVGAAADVRFPPMQTPPAVAAADVLLSVSDADSGQWLRAVRKGLSCEVEPLAVTLLRPVYRNSFFPDETPERVVFTLAISPDVLQQTARVRWVLRQAAAVVGEGECAVTAAGGTQSLACAGLAVGEYALEVQALNDGGAPVAATRIPVRRLPPPAAGTAVRIDENRNLLVDGKPFLGIGWYGSIPYEDPRPDVVALQNVTLPQVLMRLDASPLRRNYEQHGVRTIVSIENGRLSDTFALWRQDKAALRHVTTEYHTEASPSADTRDLVRQIVEAVRGEPGLLGYYIADEPEIHDMRPEYLEALYRYARDLDPYHPVFVTNDTIDGLVTHGYRCADVLSPDPYSPALDYVPNFLKKIRQVARPGQTWWLTPWHSTSHTHFSQPYGTGGPYPYPVFRNQYMAAICYGVRGFTGYVTPFFMPEPEYRYGLPHVWREVRLLEAAIAAAPPAVAPTVEGCPELAVWARECAGRVYLMAVNHKEAVMEGDLLWPPLAGRTLTLLSAGSTVTPAAGRVHVRLEPGAVWIGTDDPAASALPTSAAIEAELKRRTAEAAKPGNLLHVSRGTRATASKGFYAPWFDQYYYYALNGVTDDQGWALTHAGDQPAWFEVTLAAPAPLARLVLYADNLESFALELAEPGGARRTVALNAHGQRVTAYGFTPPVTCQKLRLTVPGGRPGGGVVNVAEVEAYSDRAEAPPVNWDGHAAAPRAEGAIYFPEAAAGSVAWSDAFAPLVTAEKFFYDRRDQGWVLKPATLRAESAPSGGVVLASRSPAGYDAMSRYVDCTPATRFLQADIADIDGQGYRFANIHLSDGSGKLECRGGINTSRPGIYTVDTHAVNPRFADGSLRRAFLTVSVAGSQKSPAGGVVEGPRFHLRWLRLATAPIDGLAVTLAGGAPLPAVLARGDRLHFEVHLRRPAADVTVAPLAGPGYKPLNLNGAASLQLAKADAAGCVWMADVTLGERTDPFECKGYPIVFRAVVAGGQIAETYASAFVSIAP